MMRQLRRGAAEGRVTGAPSQSTLLLAALPGVEQSFSGSPERFTEWRDAYGRSTKLIPVTGSTAGQSVTVAGKKGLAIAATAANCMKLSGAASGTWPAMAAPTAAAGPHGVTAYMLMRFGSVHTTIPISIGDSAQANFVYVATNVSAGKVATRQQSIGSSGAVSSANYPTGSLVVLGCRWGDPEALSGVDADPLAVKLGSESWAESDSNRAAQTAAVLRATIGGFGLETASPVVPLNGDVLAVLIYQGAHDNGTAESVRAYLEGL